MRRIRAEAVSEQLGMPQLGAAMSIAAVRVCHPQGYLPAADLPDVSNRGDTHCAIPRLSQQRAKWAIVQEIRLAEKHVA